ncbi:MAG: hypothetical protein R2788_20435 [Saprospiraceae bacterium]
MNNIKNDLLNLTLTRRDRRPDHQSGTQPDQPAQLGIYPSLSGSSATSPR